MKKPTKPRKPISQRRAGVILGYANMLVKNLVNLAYTPMLLAFVGQGDYGVFEMANSAVYSLSLLSFGFSGAYVRFYTQRAERHDDAAVRRLNGMYLLLYAIISLVALAIGLVFSANVELVFSGGLTGDEIVLAGSLMTVMSVNIAVTLFTNVFNSYITAFERFSFQQSRQMLTTLATPLLSLTLLNLGFGVVGVAMAQLTVNVVLLALNITYSMRTLGMRFELREHEVGLLKSLTVFSGWLFMNQIMDYLEINVPSVLLGALASSTVVAVFAIANKVRSVFISLSTVMSNVFVPKVNQIVARNDDNTELTHLMTRVGRYQGLLLWYVLGGFVVLGQWFIEVWAGPEYADAYWLIIIMVTPLMVPLAQNVGIEIQRAKNMHKARSMVYLAAALVNLAFTAALAGAFGYWAAAIGYAVTTLVGKGLWMNWYYQCRVGLDMGYYWRRVTPTVLVVCAAVALCLVGTAFLPVSGILTFLVWGALYSCVFGLGAWVFVLTSDERGKVMGKLRKLAGRA